jgi:hypothetical protein
MMNGMSSEVTDPIRDREKSLWFAKVITYPGLLISI